MAEEFPAGICGENWWNINPTRSVFPLMSSASTCSVAANDAGSYSNWQSDHFVDLKATRPCASEDTINNLLVSDGSLGFFDAQSHKQQQSDSSASGTGGSILMDSSTLQIMGFGLSSSTSSNWNQSLFNCSGRAESNFHSVLQEETGIDSCNNNSQIQKEWSPRNFSTASGSQVSTVDANFIKPTMDQEFSLDHHQQSTGLNCVTSSSTDFPIGSAANNNSYGYPSTLIQSLYEPPQPQNNSLFTNRSNPSMSYNSSSTATSYGNELSPTTWSKVSSFLKPPSMPKQHLSGLHFSNNTPFWNASADALNDIRAGVLASSPQAAQYQSPLINLEEKKQNCPATASTLLNKLKREESPDSAKKSSSDQPALKRTRIETPSPLPTFKVRKEKLGDRITALQQLVSPFGKTDTASVLHEAIEYIKFLHDQVLSTPYMKNGAPNIQHQQGTCDNVKESEGPKQDLRSRGLCLVPISSTFPVTNETTVDFWTPTFGGALIGR